MMKTYLLTVLSATPDDAGIRLSPGLRRVVWEQNPDTKKMIQGSILELHLPDGTVASGRLESYGISVWKQDDGSLAFDGDVVDPEIHLTISVEKSDVPVGTEVWLVHGETD